MKIIAINGSPRKNWNTATLLHKALEGAEQAGASTELIHLTDLHYRGCVSCFACKLVGGKRECVMRDDLTPVLAKVQEADAVIFGSPIYFMGITSGMAAFLERLFFPFVTYDLANISAFPKKLPSAYIYTMNLSEEQAGPYRQHFNSFEGFTERLLKVAPEVLYSYNTWQYSDYDKYLHAVFSVESKAKQKAEQFPLDCEAVCQLGERMAAHRCV